MIFSTEGCDRRKGNLKFEVVPCIAWHSNLNLLDLIVEIEKEKHPANKILTTQERPGLVHSLNEKWFATFLPSTWSQQKGDKYDDLFVLNDSQ